MKDKPEVTVITRARTGKISTFARDRVYWFLGLRPYILLYKKSSIIFFTQVYLTFKNHVFDKKKFKGGKEIFKPFFGIPRGYRI